MPLSWNEIKSRALAFTNEWKDEVSEDAEAKSAQSNKRFENGSDSVRVTTPSCGKIINGCGQFL